MILGTLFVLLCVVAVCVVHYRRAMHEFQILQKEYNPENKWSEYLQEQLPLVIRNLPDKWLGNWTRDRTERKDWPVRVSMGAKRFRTTFSQWLANPDRTYRNASELGAACKLDLTIHNWFSRWFWVSNSVPSAYVLSGRPDNSCLPLWKTTADSTAIVSTGGGAIEVWLSHEAGVPDSIADTLRGLNPWIQSTNEIPGVEQVKFIEVRLRPGNALVVPTHWWVALRSESDESWFWVHSFQNPVSWLASALRPTGI